MNITALKSFRRSLAAQRPTLGLWITLESPSITEIAVALGLDWVVIDAEHGHLDWKEIVEHLRAAVRSSTVALVRVAELNGGLIKRALDLGADGVVIPWIETAEQLRQAVAFSRYPPEGLRGIGAERATVWGQALVEHTTEANENVLVVPIVETVRAARHVPAMLAVEGVEVFFFGPADFSASAGYRGQWEGPGIAEEILRLKDYMQAAGKSCGVMATSQENLQQRLAQGFRMVGLGTDAGLLIRNVRETLRSLRRDCAPRADLETCSPATAPPLDRPPESFRPDRPEVMVARQSGPRTDLAPGVVFDGMIGAHNHARRLTTGYVRIAAGARLPNHLHDYSESITLIAGAATIEVEGRQYVLRRLDNVTIPRGLTHSAVNPSRQESVLHIAMASDAPRRTLVDKFFPRRLMPEDSTGLAGMERITRIAHAPGAAAGPNTEFIDFFNADLVPGIEMSGGFGLFHPQGRLPAHVHDFDESISIIRGGATCIVEGRRHELADGGTALQPRGRVHYFINETQGPMEMIWVYAGPRPERIIVDEHCATKDGNPWK
jgi:2-keto-3-deoxy-L-rhamnonate aldolase RhmA/quercetin dioxygenase-like cupin family protein